MKRLAILGTGCSRCQALAENVEAAAKELGLKYEIVRITEIEKILEYDVLMTPALVVDGEVKLVGIVPPVEQIKPLLA